MKPLDYTNIIIIESLRNNEIKTGIALFNDTIKPRMMQKGLENRCELILVTSRLEFFDALKTICNQIIYELVNPIIHLEMHGSMEGLQVTNGETITWKELQYKLIKMNVLTENNLFLSLATCFGGYIHSVINPKLRTPFWGFMGPFETVYPDAILANFTAFYDTFIPSGDFRCAEKALNLANSDLVSKFRLQNTEFIFARAYKNYEEKYLTPAMVEIRINEIVILSQNLPEFIGRTTEDLKALARFNMVDLNSQQKEDLKTKFLMWDLFPHNKS